MSDAPGLTAAPRLSLVIPAFDEERRLPATLPAAIAFAEAFPSGGEVIVVDNASRDRTREVAERAAAGHPSVRILSQPRRGKGAAVRTGVLAARGELVFFADADFSMPVGQIERFLAPLAAGADVAIGSREAPGARRIGEPLRRHVLGRLFNHLVRVAAVPGVADSQCGFKCFRRAAAADLFARQVETGWAFDVELLHVAQRLGYRVVEVPIDWYYRAESRVRPVRDGLGMVIAVARIRWRHRRLQPLPAQSPPRAQRQE